MSLETQFNRICENAITKVANQVERAMRAEVAQHTRTGKTISSIHIERMGKYQAFVGSDLLSAKYLDEGNQPGPIKPKHAQVLRFRGKDGRIHYAKQVSAYNGTHFVRKVANKFR